MRKTITSGSEQKIIEFSSDLKPSSALELATVEHRIVQAVVQASGQLQANANAVTRVSSPITGRVISVNAAVGDLVKVGQKLLIVSSQEIAAMESELFKNETEIDSDLSKELLEIDCDLEQSQAQLGLYAKQYERSSLLNEERIVSLADLEAVKTLLQKQNLSIAALKQKRKRLISVAEQKKLMGKKALEQRLKLLGMPESEVKAILQDKALDTQIPIVTPQGGVVLERFVNSGELIDPSKILFVVDDIDTLWLVADIFEQDIDLVKKGQHIEFTVDSFPRQVFQGTLSFVAGAISPDTRTLAVRAEIHNPGLKLKPKMFARMKILGEKKLVPCIPKRAVQDAGSQKVAYVLLGNNRFKEVVIELGEESENYFEVTNGLKIGDKVVTKGSFTLRAQALKLKRS